MNYKNINYTEVDSLLVRMVKTLGKLNLIITLVSKLQLGNPNDEALASHDWKLELPVPNSQARAWELAYFYVEPRLLKTLAQTHSISNA